jgi:hypothetical protein
MLLQRTKLRMSRWLQQCFSVTMLPVVAAVDITEELNPLLEAAIWEQVKDAAPGIASVILDAIVFTISSMAGLGAAWSRSSS